jgi:hypothetical protein
MLDEIEKALRAGSAFSELPLHDGAGKPEIKPPRQNTQIKFQDAVSTEFDGEIALALAGTGWRHSRGPVNRGVPAGAPITGPPFPPHLRLVPPLSPPRPRKLEVRIAVSDGRAPIGRSRLLRLRESDLQELIDHAARMEQR